MKNMTEYAARRALLMQKIAKDSIVIIPSAQEIPRNGDSHYLFRQNSDFYYLTGFEEPDAVLVLAPNHPDGEYILFNRKRDKEKEIWDGKRAGQEGAIKEYGAHQAYPIEEFKERLIELLKSRTALHCTLGNSTFFVQSILHALNILKNKIRAGVKAPSTFIDIAPTIHEMRLFKSQGEIATIQKAIDISKDAHIRAMKFCRPGQYEYQLEAEMSYEFQRQGAKCPAYNSIVGSGANTCILHYINNDQKIREGDLVLIDAGAEYQNYAADITRTFPANGKFSKEQRAIYELVLNAQEAAINILKPGVSWSLAQDIIVEIITKGLVDLKILTGDVKTLIEKEAYLPFYMHRSGHWLGLDVHDAGSYKVDGRWRPLEPGQVFTVEPGIYISADCKQVDERWHNIGVRIEDNVLITETGVEILSKAIPKTIAEIESLMAH